MNNRQVIYAFRWLARDTFRQARASKIFWIMLAINGLCILFCLSVRIEGGDNLRPDGDYLYQGDQLMTGPSFENGRFGFLFGAFRVSLARDREEGVHFLQTILGTWGAGAIGVLLTLIWTAGFLPEFLQPRNSSIVFAKPVPRWMVLVGKIFGIVLLVTFQATVFFVGTWLSLGITTGVWSGAYLAGIPILLVHFSAIFSFSVLLAVLTRSTVACVLGSVAFWVICVAVNYTRHAVLALPETASGTYALSPFTLLLTDMAYWMLPKPIDLLMLLERALNSGAHLSTLSNLPEFHNAYKNGKLDFGGSLLSTLAFGIAIVLVAGRQLAKTDY